MYASVPALNLAQKYMGSVTGVENVLISLPLTQRQLSLELYAIFKTWHKHSFTTQQLHECTIFPFIKHYEWFFLATPLNNQPFFGGLWQVAGCNVWEAVPPADAQSSVGSHVPGQCIDHYPS